MEVIDFQSVIHRGLCSFWHIAAQTMPLSRRLALTVGAGPRAVRIGEIESGGPAANAGLRLGDIIVALDDVLVTGTDELVRLLGPGRIERPTTLTIITDAWLDRRIVSPVERRVSAPMPN